MGSTSNGVRNKLQETVKTRQYSIGSMPTQEIIKIGDLDKKLKR